MEEFLCNDHTYIMFSYVRSTPENQYATRALLAFMLTK